MRVRQVVKSIPLDLFRWAVEVYRSPSHSLFVGVVLEGVVVDVEGRRR
jgi:hypothetical protein